MPETHEITELLLKLQNDPSAADSAALNQLTPLVYRELRRLATSLLRREHNSHTVGATALVHEAYLRLVDQTRVSWQNRNHFFAIAAQTMRRILVDQARAKHAHKRGTGEHALPLEEVEFALVAPEVDAEQLLALDTALDKLGTLDARKVKVVELRYFVGLSLEEIASALETSLATVKRDWEFARAFLAKHLTESA